MDGDIMNTQDLINQFPDISIRIDRRQLIKQLQALQDSYIELWINSKNLSVITLKDRFNMNKMQTKN
jgi:hypothetical protein